LPFSQRPRSICAQRAEQNGRCCGIGGLPQIGQGRDVDLSIDETEAIADRI
jgi:hypothetical protein